MTDGQNWGQAQVPQYPEQGYDQQPPREPPWQTQQYDPAAHRQRIGAGPQQQGQQQAPWQQYPPQQPYGQPYEFRQPQYGPSGPPQQMPPRRGRHLGRKIFAGIAGVIGVIIVISVAANSGGHTVNTTGTAEAGTATPAGGNSAPDAPPKTAGIGSAITLAGNLGSEQMSVTLVKVIGSATPDPSGFDDAPAGDRYYAAQFRLSDTGSGAYSDSPSNGAEIVDSAGQSYDASLFDTVTGCESFPGTENIAPGSSGLGCIVFEVPKSAKIVSVQFTLDSGMGPQTGQWHVG